MPVSKTRKNDLGCVYIDCGKYFNSPVFKRTKVESFSSATWENDNPIVSVNGIIFLTISKSTKHRANKKQY